MNASSALADRLDARNGAGHGHGENVPHPGSTWDRPGGFDSSDRSQFHLPARGGQETRKEVYP
jgi:hypothetical protein